MPNRNYKKGYRYERKTMSKLFELGYLPLRMAGSHSPFDVIGIGERDIKLIQVKSTKKKLTDSVIHSYKEEKILKKIKVPRNCSKEIWIYGNREFKKLIIK